VPFIIGRKSISIFFLPLLKVEIKLNPSQLIILKINVELNLILFISRGSRENKIKYIKFITINIVMIYCNKVL